MFMAGKCSCFDYKTSNESNLIFSLDSKTHSLLMAKVAWDYSFYLTISKTEDFRTRGIKS